MKVTDAKFIKSALKPTDYPKDRRPEIAFTGRSNVGKSSLLNTLVGRKDLAKTSGTPGKTQTINFFEINAQFYFVDVPGYGFAKVPLAMKNAWNRVMVAYLREREPLRLAIALVDSRHEPAAHDIHMLELLEEAQKPTVIVATKFDKLKPGERKQSIDRIRKTLELTPDAVVVPFSSETKQGVRELWSVIAEVLNA